MKIPVGKIAAFIGRELLVALASAAVERLSRGKENDDRPAQADQHEARDQHRLEPE